jgi:FkbM family methyltransferase
VLACGFRLSRVKPFERSIRRWELDHDDFYFVQIGAHNGVTSDPFQKFIAEGVWSCLLVEPQPACFEILQSIYCDRPGVHPMHVAIGPDNTSLRLFHVRDDAVGVPYWANQLASTRREVVASHADRIPNIEELIVSVDVPCRTLASLVGEAQYPRIDLLATDTEGFDFEVIRQIDALPTRPQFIYYEHLHLSATEHRESLEFLKRRGYRTHAVNNGDTFAELQRPNR